MDIVPYVPTFEVAVAFHIDSPQVVHYFLWKRTLDASWILVAHGTDEAALSVSRHTHSLGIVPLGIQLKYRIMFVGNPNSAIKASVVIEQEDSAIAEYDEGGQTDDAGVVVRSREVALVVT